MVLPVGRTGGCRVAAASPTNPRDFDVGDEVLGHARRAANCDHLTEPTFDRDAGAGEQLPPAAVRDRGRASENHVEPQHLGGIDVAD